MKLLIVESPTKARTIGKYLPKDDMFVVKASVGHIRDLPKSNKKAIDIAAGFVPHYEISPGKEKVVADLATAAKQADEIYLAPDPDREGEAIAWHLLKALHLENASNVQRVTFNEITKGAVRSALKHPRNIDDNLRRAQEARRVLDRLFGYDLSGLIWKKVRYGLSAGRVQSPALRILAERERAIRTFAPDLFWEISADLTPSETSAPLTFACTEVPKAILADCSGAACEAIVAHTKKTVDTIATNARAGNWLVTEIKETKQKRSPYPPFTTSTLQQAASSRLGFTPSRTMRAAQKLYEAGYITYMRTDSVTLSNDALTQITDVVTRDFGADLHQLRRYKTRSKNAQEAHEAIRPTDMTVQSAGADTDTRKLYSLIRMRTLTSQMVDAQILRTKIIANTHNHTVPDFALTGSHVLVPGWLLVDTAARNDDVDLPKLAIGDALTLEDIVIAKKETQPPKRYTEAGLIKELEKRGIGRPSTYASIIKTIQDRGYVTKDGRSLVPTETGMTVSAFIEEHFGKYISDDFTAEMEDELDEIAAGKRDYVKTLRDFYTPFAKDIAQKADIPKLTNLGNADPKHTCPTCGGKMVIKLSKNGTFLSCANFPTCSGARTADGAIMEGPKETGEQCPDCESSLVERTGRYGKFISCSRYPKCKYIKEDPAEAAKKRTGVACPQCKDGEMIERRGRFGVFYSCSHYPDCKNAIKARPTGRLCDYVRDDKGGVCGALMMDGTKTIPERCSDKTCPNHNPHKIKK